MNANPGAAKAPETTMKVTTHYSITLDTTNLSSPEPDQDGQRYNKSGEGYDVADHKQIVHSSPKLKHSGYYHILTIVWVV